MSKQEFEIPLKTEEEIDIKDLLSFIRSDMKALDIPADRLYAAEETQAAYCLYAIQNSLNQRIDELEKQLIKKHVTLSCDK